MKGYYFITDSDLSKAGNVSDVIQALDAGIEVVQYRQKSGESGLLYAEALKLRKLSCNAIFIVNDRIDIAMAVDADGVHIGQDDLPYEVARKLLGVNKLIGVTVHNVDEAIQAQKKGVDYLGVSPIFSTTTKPDAGKPSGPALINEIKKHCRIPVVAIGGITLENAKNVIDAGADMICAISAVVSSDNVKETVMKFQSLFSNR